MSDVRTFLKPYKKLIEKALKYNPGTHTYEDVVNGISNQSMIFWPGKESFIITELNKFPQKRSLHLFLSAGNLDELGKMRPAIEDFASKAKCDFITIAGRPGWERLGKKFGYKAVWTYLFKEIA